MQNQPQPGPPFNYDYSSVDSYPLGSQNYPYQTYGAGSYLFPPQVRREYGSFWRRVVASWLDSLIQGVVAVAIGLALFTYSASESFSAMPGFSSADSAFNIVANLLGLIFVIGFTSMGGTPGKRALGMRVTDIDGNNPGIAAAILRSCFPIMSFLVSVVWIVSNGGFKKGDSIDTLVATSLSVAGVSLLIEAIWFIGCLMVIWDDHNQALHDKIAGTYVIRT